jgi:hypothetical protein
MAAPYNAYLAPLQALMAQTAASKTPSVQAYTPGPDPYGGLLSGVSKSLAGYTPAAMSGYAQRVAQAQVAPQIAAQQAQYGSQAALLKNLYNRQTGFSLALAQLANPNAQQIQGQYQQAANTMANIGQGFEGAQQQDFENAASQAQQTAAGMTGGKGSVQGLYDPSSLASTGYTTGYALPAMSLSDQAITAANDARQRQIASANQLGVTAANTQQQQALMAADNARQLAAIRAQEPGVYMGALTNQQQMRQSQLDTLAQLTGQHANYKQNEAQMALTQSNTAAQLAEQHRQDVISGTVQGANALIAGGYLGQQGALLQGKVRGQNIANVGATIANRANLQQLTGRVVDAQGHVTDQLAPGWITIHGQPIPYESFIKGQEAQASILASEARRALYQSRMSPSSASNAAANNAKNSLVKFASQSLDAATNPKPYTSYSNVGGKSLRTTTPGTVVPYAQALQQITSLGQGVPGWAQQAQAMVDARYKPGTHGRPLSQAQIAAAGAKRITLAHTAADQAYLQGIPYTTALANAKKQSAVPFAVAQSALYNRYFLTSGLSPLTGGANTVFGSQG